MRYARILGITLLAFAMVGVLSGCDSIADKVVEKAAEEAIEGSTGNQVDITEDGVKVEGEDGSEVSVGEDVKLPADWPADVPVYEGKIAAAMSGDGTWNLSIESNDDPAKILEFYQKGLEGKGWTKVTTVTTEDGGMYGAKKDGRVAQVVASSSSGGEGETMISVAVTTE